MKQIIYLFLLIILFQSCTLNNVKSAEELKPLFEAEKVEGTFAMFDNGLGEHTVYNLKRDTTRFVPASTFKIINALISIQTGKVLNDTTIIKWDGVSRERAEWNKDMTLAEAFRVSSLPHFQELARRIGKDTFQYWLDTLHYGNMLIGGKVDEFWLNNSLKISADEQVGLMKRLYFDQLPFHVRTQTIVRDMMKREDTPQYKLYHKTGYGFDEQGLPVAWIVGWVEENRHPYFFAMNITSKDPNADLITVRMRLLKSILTKLGFLQGKM
jgi:beta-lactamase class D